MDSIDIAGLRVKGNALKRQVNEVTIGLKAIGEEDRLQELTDANLSQPIDEELLSKLPAHIRSTKRYISGFMMLEVEQLLEVGKVYAWDGIVNEWVPAPYNRPGVTVLGLAVDDHRLQFWGIAHLKGTVAGAKMYLSASVPGAVTSSRTKQQIGVGLAPDKVFLMLMGVK